MAADRLVWVTRAEPGASETGERLRALGRTPLVAPLLTVRRLPLPEPDLGGVAALAFTSANGVRAFAALTRRRDLPVYAVGSATAAAAREGGFEVAGQSLDGVAALGELLSMQLRPRPGTVLHPSARSPAGNLVGQLTAAGVRAASLTVYETVTASTLPAAAREALERGRIAAALVHSPRAARTLADLLRRERLDAALAGVDLVGLSPACMESLVGLPFGGRSVSARPAEQALLALLGAEVRR